jgi:hypothetical protein
VTKSSPLTVSALPTITAGPPPWLRHQVPLYTAGDDANAKQFRSLHAVQRHMVDRNQCK